MGAAGVNECPKSQGSFKLIKVKKGLLYSRLTMTDKEAIVTPFFFEYGRNGSGPAIRTIAGTDLYKAHRSDFEYLERVNDNSASNEGRAIERRL